MTDKEKIEMLELEVASLRTDNKFFKEEAIKHAEAVLELIRSDNEKIKFANKLCDTFEKWESSGAKYETHFEELMGICYDFCSHIITDQEMNAFKLV